MPQAQPTCVPCQGAMHVRVEVAQVQRGRHRTALHQLAGMLEPRCTGSRLLVPGNALDCGK